MLLHKDTSIPNLVAFCLRPTVPSTCTMALAKHPCKELLSCKRGEWHFSQHRMLCCMNTSAARAGGAASMPGCCLSVQNRSWKLQEGDIPSVGQNHPQEKEIPPRPAHNLAPRY